MNLTFYQELGDSSEREPSNDYSDCCSQPRWMTWASGDEDGENGNTNENKDAEKKILRGWTSKIK